MNEPEIIIAKEVIMSLPSWEFEQEYLAGCAPVMARNTKTDYSFLDYVKAVRDSGLIIQDILIYATKAALEELLNDGMLVCKHGVALTAGARYSDTIEKSEVGNLVFCDADAKISDFCSRGTVGEAEPLIGYVTPEQFEARKAEMWRTKPKQ